MKEHIKLQNADKAPKKVKKYKNARNAPKKVKKHNADNATKKVKNQENKTNKQQVLSVFSANANGLAKKIKSLESHIRNLSIGIFTIQESNYTKRGKVHWDNWEIFEAIRTQKGGGTMLGVHKSLEPILIKEYSEHFELVVVEIKVSGKVIRIMTGYGPQETWTPDQRLPFFMSLEEEIAKAELSGRSIMLCFDANSKMGPSHIPGDPHPMSENNGKVLEGILERHAMIVANGLIGKVTGVITRERITVDGIERSAIDLVCLSQDLVNDVESIVVDEDKSYCLERINTTKTGSKSIKSDHNSIISKYKFEWDMNVKKRKTEIFNLKNSEAQKKFKQITTKKGVLTKIVNKDAHLDAVAKKFLKRIEGCKLQSFKKIKITQFSNNDILDLFDKRRVLRTKTDDESKIELIKIENELAERCAEDNYKKIKDALKDIECDEGGFHPGKLWKLKKKLCPYKTNTPTAMKDPNGNLITGENNLNKHTIDHYKNVLRNREMNPDMIQMQKDKEELCEKRIHEAQTNKSEPWTAANLEEVLKYLKKDKSRDPDGNANELFHPDVAGKDMKEALLILMNRIKDELVFPTPMERCNITSIYKQGMKSVFDNYRGVFRVNILRNILDRLLYNDVYPVIDSNLTDANVGSRKGRNIRDNLFVLNAITNSVAKGDERPCDVQAYDVEKCYDALWAQECINDFYDNGCVNDKLALMHLENQNAQVAIKTSKGITERINIQNIIMQGTVMAGLFCTATTDKLAKIVYENKKLLYLYKGKVQVPPLMMVDDIITISECSSTSIAMNATVNKFAESKKLKLKPSKCCVIHVGKKSQCCPDLKVHGEKMHEAESTKYLGDILHQSGKAKYNIKERQIKAYAITAEIRAILEEVPLGKYRTEIGLQLRQAMFVNGVLFNLEVWPKLTVADITMLETVDHHLIRCICNSHAKTIFVFGNLSSAPQIHHFK